MTPTPPQTASTPALAHIVGAQIQCAQQLRGLLLEEHLALSDNNLDQLSEVCSAKLYAARQLEQLGIQFEQARPPSKTASQPPPSPELVLTETGLSEQWHQLSALARECRDQNRANGALLDARASQVRNGLKALQAAPASSYGRSGSVGASFPSRISGRA